MVYFPYFESQWASHRGLLRSASHTDLSFACKGGSQVCLPLGINQIYLSEFLLLFKVHVHRAMFVTRSPLLGELLSYPGVSIVSLPEVSCQILMLNVFENYIATRLKKKLCGGCWTFCTVAGAVLPHRLVQMTSRN